MSRYKYVCGRCKKVWYSTKEDNVCECGAINIGNKQ